MTDTMHIWNAAPTPPKDALKEVTFGRRFTSIDAYWCIREATRIFGPLGIGWGYAVEHEIVELPGKGGTVLYVRSCMDLWYHHGEERSAAIRVYDLVELSGTRNNGERFIDDEAHKKATTACISKALSYLGIGSDIFLGKHEGKYRTEAVEPSGGGHRKINPAERKRLFAAWAAKAASVGIETDEPLRGAVSDLGFSSSADLTPEAYHSLLAWVESYDPDAGTRSKEEGF